MQPLQAQAVRSPENPHPLFALLALSRWSESFETCLKLSLNLTSLDSCRAAIDALIMELESELKLRSVSAKIRKGFRQSQICRFHAYDEGMSELGPDQGTFSCATGRSLCARRKERSIAWSGGALRRQSRRTSSKRHVILISRLKRPSEPSAPQLSARSGE